MSEDSPQPEQSAFDPDAYLNAATPDGTRHIGCGMPWAYCCCGTRAIR